MRVYLDHQAATPLLPEVRGAMEPFLSFNFGNPSSRHAEGIKAREALGKAREQVAEFLGAGSPDEVFFTGNSTEAVNLAIKGTVWANEHRGRHLVLSNAEHSSVAECAKWLARRGFNVTQVLVDAEGRVSPEAVRESLREDTILVCIHQANHDIGTIQSVAEIGEIVGQRGIPLFVDAVASAGWMPCQVEVLRADLLAIAPQRFSGPSGVGVLYRRRRARIEPLVHGGEQEGGLRAGTENIPAIVGAGVAAEIARRESNAWARHASRLQARTLAGLRATVPHIKLNGPEPGPGRHPAHLSLSVEFAEGEALGLMLDVRGVAVATGSACVAKDQRVPPVLAAIGLPEALARGNVILSFGRENTDEELDFFGEAFAKAVRALREMSTEWEDFQKGLGRSALT